MPGAVRRILSKLIPRFSLRSLVVFLLLVTSSMALWHHWEPWRCELVLTGHERGNVFDARFSPDGDRIVTAGDDRTIRIWNAA